MPVLKTGSWSPGTCGVLPEEIPLSNQVRYLLVPVHLGPGSRQLDWMILHWNQRGGGVSETTTEVAECDI